MKPILVHAHVFYPELWQELKQCISNIRPYPFDLFVTMVEDHKEVIEDIRNHFLGARVEIIENRGYDVAPFLYVLNEVDLDQYDYIVKVHTKRDVRDERSVFRGLRGSLWRESLLSFLNTPERFKSYLEAFEKSPKIGMQNSYKLIVKHDVRDRLAQKRKKKFLKDRGLPVLKDQFIAGTMFFVRASIFKDIKDLNIPLEAFDTKSDHETQLAHVFERLFGYFVYKNDFIIIDGVEHRWMQFKGHVGFCLNRLFCFFYQKKRTKSGKIIVKVCKIPVFSKRIDNV